MKLSCNKSLILFIVVISVITTFILSRVYYKKLIQDYEVAEVRENELPNTADHVALYRGYKNQLKEDPNLSFEQFYLCMMKDAHTDLVIKEDWVKNAVKNNRFGDRVLSVLNIRKSIGVDFLKEYKVDDHDCPRSKQYEEYLKGIYENGPTPPE